MPLGPSTGPSTSLHVWTERGQSGAGWGVAGGGRDGAVVSDELWWGCLLPPVKAQLYSESVSVLAMAMSPL